MILICSYLSPSSPLNKAFTVSVKATAIGTGSLKERVKGLGPRETAKLSTGVPLNEEREERLSEEVSLAGRKTSKDDTRTNDNDHW